MFKELGQIAGLMRNLPKIQEEMEKLQQRPGPDHGRGRRRRRHGQGPASTARWKSWPAPSATRRSSSQRPRDARRPDPGGGQPGAREGAAAGRRGDRPRWPADLGLPPGMDLPGVS